MVILLKAISRMVKEKERGSSGKKVIKGESLDNGRKENSWIFDILNKRLSVIINYFENKTIFFFKKSDFFIYGYGL
jgi:hypothetical protein